MITFLPQTLQTAASDEVVTVFTIITLSIPSDAEIPAMDVCKRCGDDILTLEGTLSNMGCNREHEGTCYRPLQKASI